MGNEKIKRLRLLRGSAKERKKSGLFTAEGVKIFKEAPKEAVCETYVSESFARENACLLADCAFYIVEDGLFERICDTKTPQGIITVFRRPSCRIEDLPENGPLIVVLENVQDPGNIGTIIRTAEGAGASVILGDGCADVFSPKAVRSTMGSLFRVPIVFESDLTEAVKKLKALGVKVYAAHLAAEKYYDELDYSEGTAFLVGNEGNGLSKELADEADIVITHGGAGTILTAIKKGKKIIAVVNFPPRQIADFFSEVLVLGTYSQRGVVLITPDKPEEVKDGDKLG